MGGVARGLGELRGLEPPALAQAMWRNAVAALPRLAPFADAMAPSGGHQADNNS